MSRLALAGLAVALALGARDASAQAWKKKRDECISASEDGQLSKVKGQLRAAREKLLACADKTCPGAIRKDCEAGLAELERLIPSVVFGAKDGQGKDLVDVKVSFDGTALLERLDGKAVEVDPGQHSVLFEAEGLPPHEEKLLFREGEKARVVVVTLAKKEAKPKRKPKAKPEAAARPTTATWVVGGVGAAALAGAGVVGFVALQKRSSLYDSCGKAGTCSQDEVDSVYRLYNVSYVAAGIGGALLATSAVMYFTTSKPASEERAGVTLSPWPGGATLRGRF